MTGLNRYVPFLAFALLAAGCGNAQQQRPDQAAAALPAEDRPVRTNEFTTPQRPEDTPRRGAISRQQAQRSGADGRPECSSSEVRDLVASISEPPGAPFRSLGSFLTDSRGVSAWGDETLGAGLPVGGSRATFADELHALCYFQGAFTVKDASIEDDMAAVPARFIVIDVPQVQGRAPSVLQTAVETMAVIAPATPKLSLQTGRFAGRGRVTAEQPAGVRMRD